MALTDVSAVARRHVLRIENINGARLNINYGVRMQSGRITGMKLRPRIAGFRSTLCICMAAFASVFLSGCTSVQNGEMSTSDEEILINPDNGKYCVEVGVDTQTSDPSKKPSIDANRSFAISPSGKRFKLRVEKNEYIEENIKTNPVPAIYANLSLIDPSQQPGKSDDIFAAFVCCGCISNYSLRPGSFASLR